MAKSREKKAGFVNEPAYFKLRARKNFLDSGFFAHTTHEHRKIGDTFKVQKNRLDRIRLLMAYNVAEIVQDIEERAF